MQNLLFATIVIFALVFAIAVDYVLTKIKFILSELLEIKKYLKDSKP